MNNIEYKMNDANIKVLGIRIDNFSHDEIERWVRNVLVNPPKQKFVATLNPEIILRGHRDKDYANVLNSADLNLCDGLGIKFVSWLRNKKMKARYTGADLTDFLLKLAKEKNLNVLVVVSKNSFSDPEEIMRAVESKYDLTPQAKYFEDNFFESEEAKSTEIVLVNFGAPEQEKFIFENRARFPKTKILVGVGGTFDFITEKIKRAPGWMRKTGFEWLWRLLQEPKRLKRIINAVIVFPWIFLTNKKIR